MLKEDHDREFYESYMAQCSWLTAAMIASLAGKEIDIPQYVEVTRPELKKKEPTAEEIKNQLLERLKVS